MYPVDQKLIVQVGPRCGSGGAHGANDLPLLYFFTFFDFEPVQVKVVGHELFAVLDKNIVTVRAGITRFYHAAVTGGVDRCAPGRSVVGAAMGSLCLVDGVQTIGVKVGTDPRESNGARKNALRMLTPDSL